jgi:hypothetical protein
MAIADLQVEPGLRLVRVRNSTMPFGWTVSESEAPVGAPIGWHDLAAARGTEATDWFFSRARARVRVCLFVLMRACMRRVSRPWARARGE